MEFISRFKLKEDSASKARQWLLDNADNLNKQSPANWTFLGAYFTVMGFGSYDVEHRWGLTDYADMNADISEQFAKLIKEWGEFTSDGQSFLMKSPTDVQIIGEDQ